MPKVIKHHDEYGNMAEDYSYFYLDGDIILEVVDLCNPPNIGDSVKISGSVYVTKNVINDIESRSTEYHLSR